jgi:hypothetical protein
LVRAVCFTGLTFLCFPPSNMLAHLYVGRPAARAPPTPERFLGHDLVWGKNQMYSRTPKRRARPHAHARDRRSTGIQSPPPCGAAPRRGGGGRGARAGASAHGGVVRCGYRAPRGGRALWARAGASPRRPRRPPAPPPAERIQINACPGSRRGRPRRWRADVSTSVDFCCGGSLHVSIVLGFSYGRSMRTHLSPTDNTTTPPSPPRRVRDARGWACAVE